MTNLSPAAPINPEISHLACGFLKIDEKLDEKCFVAAGRDHLEFDMGSKIL